MSKYRYTRVPGSDNSTAMPTKQIQNPAYAATIALANLDCEKNFIDFQLLTGALTVNADITNPFAGDKLELAFVSDGTGRVVTLGTGFTTNSTITLVASKKAIVNFTFHSASSTWVETGRFIEA